MTLGDASQVPVTAELVADEIRALHKGRGLQSGDLDNGLGPYLRELLGNKSFADTAALRRSLTIELTRCLSVLPAEVRLPVTASLAMSGRTKEMSTLRVRLEWLADQIDRNYRTAERRMDEAEMLLAEQIANELLRRRGRTPTAPEGWYLDEFRAVLRLDGATPESHERRRIVSAQANLQEVMAWLDVPRSPDKPGPKVISEVLYGGRLVRREQPSRNRFVFVVELPEPLQPGEMHEYGLIVRMPPDEPMRPHYIFTPECECNTFDLTVRFDSFRLPKWVRLVNGETVRMFDEPRPGTLAVNQAGEVHVQFDHPVMYLGYGLQWEP